MAWVGYGGMKADWLCLDDSEWAVLSSEELVLGICGRNHELSLSGFLATAQISSLPVPCQSESWWSDTCMCWLLCCFGWVGGWSHYLAKADLKLIILLLLILCTGITSVWHHSQQLCVCNSESELWFSLHRSSIAQLLIPWSLQHSAS